MKIFKKALGSPSASKDNNTPNPSSKHPLSQPPIPPNNYGHFPPTFSIYFSGPSDDKETAYFVLGLESESENKNNDQITPLNAIAFYKRTAKHQLTLLAGPQHDTSPVLALAGIERFSGSTHLIALPGQESGSGSGGGVVNRFVRLKYGGGDYFKYCFELEVGHGHGQHTESFEWRTGNTRPQENKPFKRWLVRLGNNPDSDSRDREEEVIGTWVKEQDMSTAKQTTAKMGTFSFQGSGATGDLGPYCTLAIVVSLLRINQADWMAAVAADIESVSPGKVALGVGSFSVTSAGLV